MAEAEGDSGGVGGEGGPLETEVHPKRKGVAELPGANSLKSATKAIKIIDWLNPSKGNSTATVEYPVIFRLVDKNNKRL